MQQPNLIWDLGTAYDLFVSLHVLHAPDRWGLRGAWAAGVRSRLSAENRDFLRDIESTLFIPLWFIHSLPNTKDAKSIINAIADISPAERLPALISIDRFREKKPDSAEIYDTVARNGSYTNDDVIAVHRLQDSRYNKLSRKEIERRVHWWANGEQFGHLILSSLQNYFDVFFAEEEQRLLLYLSDALENARNLSETMPLEALLEELSGGVRYEETTLEKYNQLIIAPSFWTTPFLIASDISPGVGVYLFGARPDEASLVPGGSVPDMLQRTLKALADPTRLKIMKYLASEPQTPTELAKRLRLRPPTVIHHLHTLRLAQLVYVTVSAEGKRYAARTEAINTAMTVLEDFLRP